MKSLKILLIIALVFLLYIVFRFSVKRTQTIITLKKFCKKHNYSCKISPHCMLPLNSTACLVQIETDTAIYPIKLFGLLRKHCEIHFWNLQEYSVEWYFSRYGLVGSTPIGLTNTKRRRSLGDSSWAVFPGEKMTIPILLISPAQAPVRLTKTDVTCFTELRAGDKVGDALFADLDFLLRYIAKSER